MTTEELDSNLAIIFKDRVSSSELSDVLANFKNITVNNNNDKKLQSKKRKRNKYYYTENVTHGFQSSIASNKKIDIIKYCGGSGSAVIMRDYMDVLDSNNLI